MREDGSPPALTVDKHIALGSLGSDFSANAIHSENSVKAWLSTVIHVEFNGVRRGFKSFNLGHFQVNIGIDHVFGEHIAF